MENHSGNHIAIGDKFYFNLYLIEKFPKWWGSFRQLSPFRVTPMTRTFSAHEEIWVTKSSNGDCFHYNMSHLFLQWIVDFHPQVLILVENLQHCHITDENGQNVMQITNIKSDFEKCKPVKSSSLGVHNLIENVSL